MTTSAADAAKGNRQVLKEGEWACPDARCSFINSKYVKRCQMCSKDRPKAKGHVGHEIGKEMAEKSKGLFSAEDWQCSKCGNVNWARRNTCNICNAPKFGEVEARTGYGGGYMDRQVVEYVEHNESDSEYDEFGRKKKKFRKISDSIGGDDDDGPGRVVNNNDKHPERKIAKEPVKEKVREVPAEEGNEEDEEDEDDDDDLSKYRLDDEEDDLPVPAKVAPPPKKTTRRSRESSSESDSSGGSSSGSSESRSRSASGSSTSSKSRSRSGSRTRSSTSSRRRSRERELRSRRRSRSRSRSDSRSRTRSRSPRRRR